MQTLLPALESCYFRGECQEQILKFPAARYKKFETRDLAQAFVNGTDNPAEGKCSKIRHQIVSLMIQN